MLSTIVRALIVFVVFCLVSAARPAPRPVYDDPQDAQLDVAKPHVDLAAPRRPSPSQDRMSRASVLAILVEPVLVTPPLCFVTLERAFAPIRAFVPIVFARSSRGPPVG